MKFYDILGNEILSSEEYYDEGFQRITHNFFNLASGVYFNSIEAFEKFESGKLMYLK